MPEQDGGGNRGRRGPSGGRRQWQGRRGPVSGQGGASRTRPRPGGGGAQGSSGIRLSRLASGDYELVHPRKVEETREDYEEGMELWNEGDVESARDALRYVLSACHANLWAHVALGRIALAEFRDPALCGATSDMRSSWASVLCPVISRAAWRRIGRRTARFTRLWTGCWNLCMPWASRGNASGCVSFARGFRKSRD